MQQYLTLAGVKVRGDAHPTRHGLPLQTPTRCPSTLLPEKLAPLGGGSCLDNSGRFADSSQTGPVC